MERIAIVCGGGLSQLLDEFFFGDVVPEANFGDYVV